MKRLLFLLTTAALSVTAFSADTPPPAKPAAPAKPKFQKETSKTPDGYQLKEFTIATYPEEAVVLSVYVPDKKGSYPCILDIHGGGWKARQIEVDKPMMQRLAARGYVTALIAYRLSTTSKYPAALNDCKSALRFLRAHAAEFQIDPERIGVMGGSAGGHLSGLTAMTSGKPEFEGDGPNKEQSSAVQACIVMAATQDLVAAYKDKPNESAVAFFGVAYADNPDLYAQASPITHVRPSVPPTIFIEGEKDTLKIGRAEMQEKLKALNIETALYTLKDAPHPFWMSAPWCDQTVEIADTFFKKYLGTPKF